MNRNSRATGLAFGPTALFLAALVVVACTSAPGASSSAAPPSVSSTPTVTTQPTLGAEPSGSRAATDVIVRTLGIGSSQTFPLLVKEIMERGDGECAKTREGARTIREETVKTYLASATGVERLIGLGVWLGTIEGAARSLASVEVVVPGQPSRLAYIILRVPAASDIDAPAGALAAIEISRLDAPSGASVPQGAELWFFTGDLVASVPC